MASYQVYIDRPRDWVWRAFTEPATWAEWYGGALERVTPGWEVGASVVWERGYPSEITAFVPMEKVEMTDGSGTRTVWEFQAVGTRATRVILTEDFSTSRLAVSDPAARRAQNEGTLAGLQSYVESGARPRREAMKVARQAQRQAASAPGAEPALARQGMKTTHKIILALCVIFVLACLCLMSGTFQM